MLHTEWAHGLTAHATRKFNARVRVKIKGQDQVFNGEVVSTRLVRDGAEIGQSLWFPAQQTFMWRIGRTTGSLSPEVLSANNNGPGGWLFTVNPAWVNIQTIAFQHFATQPKPAAQASNCRPRAGALARLADFLVPTLHANEPGCDFPFVWLNGTDRTVLQPPRRLLRRVRLQLENLVDVLDQLALRCLQPHRLHLLRPRRRHVDGR